MRHKAEIITRLGKIVITSKPNVDREVFEEKIFEEYPKETSHVRIWSIKG